MLSNPPLPVSCVNAKIGSTIPVIFPVLLKLNPGGSTPSPLPIKYSNCCPVAISLSGLGMGSPLVGLTYLTRNASPFPTIGGIFSCFCQWGSSAPCTIVL